MEISLTGKIVPEIRAERIFKSYSKKIILESARKLLPRQNHFLATNPYRRFGKLFPHYRDGYLFWVGNTTLGRKETGGIIEQTKKVRIDNTSE